jgi:hypothetical protein
MQCSGDVLVTLLLLIAGLLVATIHLENKGQKVGTSVDEGVCQGFLSSNYLIKRPIILFLLFIVEQLNCCTTHDCHGITTRAMAKVLGYDWPGMCDVRGILHHQR